jgi:flagellin
MRINYNVSALVANNALHTTDNRLTQSLERLSSGLKIASAKDNPSGLAMARRMNSQIRSLDVADDSDADGISIVETADAVMSEIHDMLQRMNELAIKASTGTMTTVDRETVDEEVQQLKDEIQRVADTTEFNGQKLLDGTFDLKGYAAFGGVNAEGNIEFSNELSRMSVLTYSDNVPPSTLENPVRVPSLSEVMTLGDVTAAPDPDAEAADKMNFSFDYDVKSNTITSYNEKAMLIDTEGVFYKITEVVDNIATFTSIDGEGKSISMQFERLPSDIKDGVETVHFTNNGTSGISADGKEYTEAGNPMLELTGNGAMAVQIGANEGQYLDIRIPRLSLANIGIQNVTVSDTEEKGNGQNALAAIEQIKRGIAYVSQARSRLGAYQNRLEHTNKSLDVTVENMTAAYSRIMDVDMAEEMTNYSTQTVLQQAGTSMLAQANERPSEVLQLLQ